jgi:DNA end-binding protein Ku
VAPGDVELDAPKKAPSKREVEMASRLVASLETSFDPKRYADTHRKAVLALIARKRSGKEIELPEPEPAEPSDDLLATLEASLEGAKG